MTSTWFAALIAVAVVGAAVSPLPAAPASSNVLPYIGGFQMFNANDGWATTFSGGWLLVTRDGDVTWTSDNPVGHVFGVPDDNGVPANSFLENDLPGAALAAPACDAMACQRLWVEGFLPATGRFDLFTSTDGARTWTTLPATGLPQPLGVGSQQPLWAANDLLTFPIAQDGWAIWYPDTPYVEDVVYHSTTGGRTWLQAGIVTLTHGMPGSPPPDGVPSRLFFATPNTGWFVGTSNGFAWLYATRDGGKTWGNVHLPIPRIYDGYEVTTNVPRFFSPSAGVLPVTFTGSQQISGSSHPVTFRTLVGMVLYHTSDGGQTWTATQGVTLTGNAAGVPPWDVLDAEHAWLVGGHVIEATADGGDTWTAISPDTPTNFVRAVDFVTPDHGWMLENGNTGSVLLRTLNGGHHWTTVPAVAACGSPPTTQIC